MCGTGRPVLLRNHHLPAVPGISRKPLGGLEGPAGGVPSSQSYPRAQASSLSTACPVQRKTRVTSPSQVQPHPEIGKKRGGRQGPLLSDRAGAWARDSEPCSHPDQGSGPSSASHSVCDLGQITPVSPSLSFHFCKMGINNHRS